MDAAAQAQAQAEAEAEAEAELEAEDSEEAPRTGKLHAFVTHRYGAHEPSFPSITSDRRHLDDRVVIPLNPPSPSLYPHPHRHFGTFITLMILLNTLVLALDKHPMDQDFADMLEIFNFVFTGESPAPTTCSHIRPPTYPPIDTL